MGAGGTMTRAELEAELDACEHVHSWHTGARGTDYGGLELCYLLSVNEGDEPVSLTFGGAVAFVRTFAAVAATEGGERLMARVKHGSTNVFLEPNEFRPDEVITVEYSHTHAGTDIWLIDGHDGIVLFGSPDEVIAFARQLTDAATAKLSERKAQSYRDGDDPIWEATVRGELDESEAVV